MSKSFMVLSLISLSSIMTQNAFAGCYVVGEASIRGRPEFRPTGSTSNAATSEQTWNDTETVRYTGSELGTQLAGAEGTDLVFRGPVQPGFLVFGPYATTQGSVTSIRAQMRASIAWSPDGREVCTHHKTKPNGARVCTAKGIEYDPTSFVVDISTNSGAQVHYTAQFTNVNSLSDTFIDLPELICDGPINGYETRIRDLSGGSVEFRIHEAVIQRAWVY